MPRRLSPTAGPTWCRWRGCSSTIRIGAGTPPRRSAPRWRGRCNMPAPVPSCGRPRRPRPDPRLAWKTSFSSPSCSAACHAGWNALIKVGLDPLSTTTLISIGSGAVALVFLPLTGMPVWDAWPGLIASVVIHLVYFAALIEAYRTGDLGQVYPIARGSAPLMTAAAATAFIGETLSLIGWSGIVALVAGVFLLSAHGGRELAHIDRRAVGFALFTALTICAYSVVDGIGARLSANPNAYSLWLFVGI